MECIISALVHYILLNLTIDCIGHKEHTVNIVQKQYNNSKLSSSKSFMAAGKQHHGAWAPPAGELT